MSNRLGNNGGRAYSFLFQPVTIDCNFVVDATNGNGLGIRSLKGSGVKNVFMNTSASITGTVATTANQITSIAQGTSALTIGMPVQGTGIPVGTTITSIISSSAIGISATPTGNHSSETINYQGLGVGGYPNPNPAAGYALIQLKEGYYRYEGGFSGFSSPLSGSNVAVNSTALTVGQPYVIVSVGHGTAGAVTIAPIADVSGSLASTYFVIYDSYGNKYVVWFSVSGVGSAPIGVSGTLIQQSISTNDTASTIGSDLVITLENLLAAQPGNTTAPSGVFSFTATGTSTVTATNTLNVPFPGGPADGAIATGFTFAVTKDQTNLQNWQAVGLPKGVTPNVGAAFVATTTGYSSRGGSTGLVQTPSVSGVLSCEVVGDPNQTLNPTAMGGSPHVGGWVLVQFLAPTQATVDAQTGTFISPMIPTAPANNSVAGMTFNVESKSVIVAGE